MVLRLTRADGTVDPPPDIVLTPDEMVIWRQFVVARAPTDWRDLDLVLLTKIVRFERKIRECEALIDQEGYVIFNARGNPVKNPLLEVTDGFTRQQLAVIRTLSLGSPAAPSTLRKNADLANQDQEDVRKLRESGAANLLAV